MSNLNLYLNKLDFRIFYEGEDTLPVSEMDFTIFPNAIPISLNYEHTLTESGFSEPVIGFQDFRYDFVIKLSDQGPSDTNCQIFKKHNNGLVKELFLPFNPYTQFQIKFSRDNCILILHKKSVHRHQNIVYNDTIYKNEYDARRNTEGTTILTDQGCDRIFQKVYISSKEIVSQNLTHIPFRDLHSPERIWNSTSYKYERENPRF